MSTTSQNNQIHNESTPLYYPVLTDGTYDVNQGDAVWFDSSVHAVKPVDSDAHAAYFAGVALQQSKLNVYGTAQYPQAGIQVATRGVFKFKTTAGDTLNHGDAVYIGADAQTVTNTAGGKTSKIGYVWLRPGQSAVSGASGTNIEVLITPLFPITGGL